MSIAATLVTPQELEGALSTPSSENGSAPESDTSLVGSTANSQDNHLLAHGGPFTPIPLESPLTSELPGSPLQPDKLLQLKERLEGWIEYPGSTKLVLNSVSMETFNLIRPGLMTHASSSLCEFIKVLYIPRLQQLDLRKLSNLHLTASTKTVFLILEQIKGIIREPREANKGEVCRDPMEFQLSTGKLRFDHLSDSAA